MSSCRCTSADSRQSHHQITAKDTAVPCRFSLLFSFTIRCGTLVRKCLRIPQHDWQVNLVRRILYCVTVHCSSSSYSRKILVRSSSRRIHDELLYFVRAVAVANHLKIIMTINRSSHKPGLDFGERTPVRRTNRLCDVTSIRYFIPRCSRSRIITRFATQRVSNKQMHR